MPTKLLAVCLLISTCGLPFILQAQTPELRLKMMKMTYEDITQSFKKTDRKIGKIIKNIESFLDVYADDIPDTKADNEMRKHAGEILKSIKPNSGHKKVVTHTKPHEYPELIGGMRHLQRKINYTLKARSQGIEGRVIVQFIINKQGEVEDPKTLNSLGYGLDEEAIRVVKSSKFKPGKIDSKPMRVKFTLPITFYLQ